MSRTSKNDDGDTLRVRVLRWFASLRPKTDPPAAATPPPIAPSHEPEEPAAPAERTKAQQHAFDLLAMGGLFYGDDEAILNMNDTWGWATAWGEKVEDDELENVAYYFAQYGFCGVLFWMSEKHNGMASEFHHYNRMIEFVRKEEAIKDKHTSHSDYAYDDQRYEIGTITPAA